MKRSLYISLGGMLGAVLRFVIKDFQIIGDGEMFFLNTALVNITGSFLLAVLLTAALEIPEFDQDIRVGAGTGFLGAYTTFSTLCKEFVVLLQDGSYAHALAYMLVSVSLGLAAAFSGVTLARKLLVNRILKKKACRRNS